MAEFKLSRKLLSAYYIAALISYPLFDLIKESINIWVAWLVSATKVATGASLQGNASLWFALFLVCFAVTFAIRKWIVEPLGFFINEEGANNVELWVTLFLVLGAYIYFINQVFNQPMPTEWPIWILKLVDGYKHTYTVTSVQSIEENNTWVIVPWLWNVAPIAFMYFNVKIKPAGK
jgi:hypothetical protein